MGLYEVLPVIFIYMELTNQPIQNNNNPNRKRKGNTTPHEPTKCSCNYNLLECPCKCQKCCNRIYKFKRRGYTNTKVSRCTHCKHQHRKCEGGIPCIRCTKFGLNCILPTRFKDSNTCLHQDSHDNTQHNFQFGDNEDFPFVGYVDSDHSEHSDSEDDLPVPKSEDEEQNLLPPGYPRFVSVCTNHCFRINDSCWVLPEYNSNTGKTSSI